MALWEGEHGLVRQVNQAAAISILALIFLYQLVQVNCFVGYVLGTLLVILKAEGVAALVHVHGAETEAQDVELARLSGALTVALAVDELLIGTALLKRRHAWLHASTIVVNHAIGADRCTHVALSNDEAGRALREPVVATLLALAALLFLTVSAPQRKGLLAAKLCHLEELGAREVVILSQHHHVILIKMLVISSSSLTLLSLLLSTRGLSIGMRLLLASPTLTSLALATLALTALATLLSPSVTTTSTGGRSVTVVHWLVGSWMGLSAVSRGGVSRLGAVGAGVSRGLMRSLVTGWQHIASVRLTAMTGSRLRMHRLSRMSAGPSATTASALSMSTSAARVGLVSIGVTLRALIIVRGG